MSSNKEPLNTRLTSKMYYSRGTAASSLRSECFTFNNPEDSKSIVTSPHPIQYTPTDWWIHFAALSSCQYKNWHHYFHPSRIRVNTYYPTEKAYFCYCALWNDVTTMVWDRNLMKCKDKKRQSIGVAAYCRGRVPRERATVRSTIYNQIGCACVSVCLHYAPDTHRGNASSKAMMCTKYYPLLHDLLPRRLHVQ